MAKLTGRMVVDGVIAGDMTVVKAFMGVVYNRSLDVEMIKMICKEIIAKFTNYDLDHEDMPKLINMMASYTNNDDYFEIWTLPEAVISHVLSNKRA